MTDSEQPKNKGGRPRKHPIGTRVPTLAFRVRAGLRDKLEESAKRAERSISEEIENRLEQSFDAERRLSNQSLGLKLALRSVERCWQFLEERISDEWAEHESGRAAMREAMMSIIDFGFPAKAREEMTQAERTEVDQLLPQVENVVEAITWRNSDPREIFPENHLLRAANKPVSFAESHAKWLKMQAAKGT